MQWNQSLALIAVRPKRDAERHDDPRVKQHQKADIRMRLKLSSLRPAEAEQAERAAPGQNHKAVKRGNRIDVPRQHVGGKEAVTDKRNEQECAFILRDGKAKRRESFVLLFD